MKKLLSIIAIATAILLVATACQTNGSETHTPIPVKDMGRLWAEQEVPDDIMPVPGGGPAYRANVHQQGEENPWPPIDIADVIIVRHGSDDEVHITYRNYIETKAGEARNNVIKVIMAGKEVNSLSLYMDNIPKGVTLVDGMQWSGPSARASVLVIDIAQDVAPGKYPLEIGLEINGKDYDTVPCIIEVVEPAPYGIPAEPEEPYSGNHGITTTKATPQPGDNITSSSALMIKLTTDDLIEKSNTVVIGKVIDIFPARRVNVSSENPMTTDEVIEVKTVITDVVIEVERYLYGQPWSPYIAIMVRGGRVEQTLVWVEDQPEFNLGEEVILFLNHPELKISPPEGFEDAQFYMVTGNFQGKLGRVDGNAINLEGKSVAISEIEQQIALIHGGK